MVMSEPSTNYLTTILVRNLGRNWRWQTSKSALTGQQQEHPCWVAFAGFSGGTYLYLPISTCQQSNSLLRKVLGFSTSLEWRYGKFIGQDHPTVKEQDWDAPPPPLMSFSSFLLYLSALWIHHNPMMLQGSLVFRSPKHLPTIQGRKAGAISWQQVAGLSGEWLPWWPDLFSEASWVCRWSILGTRGNMARILSTGSLFFPCGT